MPRCARCHSPPIVPHLDDVMGVDRTRAYYSFYSNSPSCPTVPAQFAATSRFPVQTKGVAGERGLPGGCCINATLTFEFSLSASSIRTYVPPRPAESATPTPCCVRLALGIRFAGSPSIAKLGFHHHDVGPCYGSLDAVPSCDESPLRNKETSKDQTRTWIGDKHWR